MKKQYLTDKEGNKVLPITHVKAVLDDDGNPIDSIIGSKADAADVYTKTQGQQFEQTIQHEVELLDGHTVIITSTLPSDEDPAEDGDPNVIYRVPDDPSSPTTYTDYMYNEDDLTTPVPIATYDFPGVDDEPTAGSENLVKSGDVFNVASDVRAFGIVPNDTTWEEGGVIMADTGKRANVTAFNSYISGFIPVSQGDYYYVGVKASASFLPIAGYSEADQETWVSSFTPARTSYNGDVQKITIPSGVNYVRIAFIPETVSFAGIWSVQDTGILPDMVGGLNSAIQTAFENVTSLQNVNDALKEEKCYGTNIINPDDVVSGYLNVNGIVGDNPGLYVTGFIPVSNGQSVQAFTKVSTSASILCFAAYDKNLQFLRGVTNNASYTQQGNEVFVRITLPVPTDTYPTLFANYGNSLLSYEAYISVKEKVSANAQNIQSISLAKDFIMENYASYEYVKYIKSLKIYVPDSLVNHNFGISIIGWNTTYNRFYFRLYDKTESTQSVYFFKEYESKPQSGIELLSGFPGSGGMSSNGGLYYFEIEIDWSLVDTYTDSLLSGLSVNVYPVSSVEHIGNTIDTVITDNIQIPDGTHLVGKGNVTIRFGKGGRFTLGSGCSVEGITFEYIGNGRISSRTEDGYIFTPIITLQQLSDETASAFYDTENYGTIVIPSSSYNVIVSGNKFLYFNNCAIYDAGDRHTDYNHQLIANNMFVYCKTGLLVTEEFSRVIGNYFYGCVVGIYLNYGNPNILGNNFVRCDCGIYLSKVQTAHGHIVSCHLAHLGVASLYAQTIGDGLGLILDGCQIAQGPVIAKYAVGLRIQNCRLDTNFVIADGGKCSIVNNNMRKSYATGAGVADIFDVPEDTVISGNRALLLSESDELYNRV